MVGFLLKTCNITFAETEKLESGGSVLVFTYKIYSLFNINCKWFQHSLFQDNLDGEEQSLQAPAAMSLEESNHRINRLIAMHNKLSEANMASMPSQVEKRKRSTSAVNASYIVHISETDQTSFPTPISSVHKRSKRVGSKKSLVWKHFDTGLRGHDPIATCKYCG